MNYSLNPTSIKYNELTIVLLFLVLISTETMRNNLFYINWVLGFIIVFYFMMTTFLKSYIERSVIIAALLMSLWLIVPLIYITSNNLIDGSIHLERMIIHLFYIFIGVIVSSYLLNINLESRHTGFIIINVIWVLISIFTFMIYVSTGGLLSEENFSGVVDNRNSFAMITTLLSSYIVFFQSNIKFKKTAFLIIISSIFLVLVTLSIKNIIGLFLILIIGKVNMNSLFSRKKGVRTLVAISFILLSILLILTTDNPIMERLDRFLMVFSNPGELRETESAFLRFYFITQGLEIFKENFFTGIGIDNSRYYLGMYSHNNYIEVALSGGIFSLIAFYGPLICILVHFWKIKKQSIFSKYILCLIIYKLFYDIGAVTYNTLMWVIVTAIIYIAFLKSRSLPKNRYLE
ncbi:hypothetical protein ABC345_17960 [Shouchella sp. 1P09AA]|uniref:O-antigen ligase family protein n=1 Tax=unclassified Shouchella TaxID=2893065 RepID=UPI0039A3ABCF